MTGLFSRVGVGGAFFVNVMAVVSYRQVLLAEGFVACRSLPPAESGHTRLMLPDLWTGNRRPLLHRHFNQRPRMIP